MTAPHADATAPLAHADVIVLDYLAALWAESEDLTPDRRDELMSTVADYIAMRRTAFADPIADPGQILGRLGPPEALVASVRRGRMPTHLRLPAPPPPRPPAPARVADRSTGAESTAIALLMAGAFVLPVVSPLAAMVIVSSSPRWTVAQKAAGWVLTMGAILAGFVLGVTATVFTQDDGFGLVVLYLTAVAGAFVAGVTLLPGLTARRTA
jgi:hypothetical protein